jgi:hypothetical protein
MIFILSYPLAATDGAPVRVVVTAQDSFATPPIYKWILMQHLKGFHEFCEITWRKGEKCINVMQRK